MVVPSALFICIHNAVRPNRDEIRNRVEVLIAELLP
ncbi:hypothetical protein C8K36_10816 [Rhodococcus sp. OK519]|nr:hypothetical protein C8K36_10816 [Rhodococcus sp. OK519]